MKRCKCGQEYTAETWAQLQLKGWCGGFWAVGKAMAVELRNCAGCGSTIGVEVEAPKKTRRANEEIKAAAQVVAA